MLSCPPSLAFCSLHLLLTCAAPRTQDLLEGGAGAAATQKNPNALYEIDKLSLDHVTVFPDGELNVRCKDL